METAESCSYMLDHPPPPSYPQRTDWPTRVLTAPTHVLIPKSYIMIMEPVTRNQFKAVASGDRIREPYEMTTESQGRNGKPKGQ